MPLRKNDVRDLLEAHNGNAMTCERELVHLLGLADANGSRYHDSMSGMPVVRDPVEAGQTHPRLRPGEFSLAHLGRGLLGDDLFESMFAPGSNKFANILPMAGAMRTLMEAGEGGVMASAYANVNAFTAVVTGLLEVSVMEGWQNPEFIADQLMPAEATKMFDGRKVIGSSRLGDQAEERQPGMPTKRAQIGERWITQPRTVENALAVEVFQETVYLDLTGQVLSEANDLGTWLGFRKEYRCIDAYIGSALAPQYSFMGNTYAPYITGGYYDNDVPNNELLHWDSVQNCLIKFRDMTDPQSGTRVLIQPDTVLVNLEKQVVARSLMGDLADGAQYRDAPGSAVNPQQIRTFAQPYKGKFTILSSPLVFQRMTDPVAIGGLGLTPTQAAKYWFMFQRGKAIKYAQNWPLRVQQASPGQIEMIDRGVVLYAKADERGIPFWHEPRYNVRNKP